ncbi:MAG: hypothetical protein V4714_02690 [Bacteroidota bacterium]
MPSTWVGKRLKKRSPIPPIDKEPMLEDVFLVLAVKFRSRLLNCSPNGRRPFPGAVPGSLVLPGKRVLRLEVVGSG